MRSFIKSVGQFNARAIDKAKSMKAHIKDQWAATPPDDQERCKALFRLVGTLGTDVALMATTSMVVSKAAEKVFPESKTKQNVLWGVVGLVLVATANKRCNAISKAMFNTTYQEDAVTLVLGPSKAHEQMVEPGGIRMYANEEDFKAGREITMDQLDIDVSKIKDWSEL